MSAEAGEWRRAAEELDQAGRPEAARIARLMADETTPLVLPVRSQCRCTCLEHTGCCVPDPDWPST